MPNTDSIMDALITGEIEPIDALSMVVGVMHIADVTAKKEQEEEE